MQLKAFLILLIVTITGDAYAYEGKYRTELLHNVEQLWDKISDMKWSLSWKA